MPDYGLLVTPPAQRALDRLPERVAAAIAELLTGDLLAAPRRVGKPLRRELAGIWSARRGSYWGSMRSTTRRSASLFSGSTIAPTSTGPDNQRVGGAPVHAGAPSWLATCAGGSGAGHRRPQDRGSHSRPNRRDPANDRLIYPEVPGRVLNGQLARRTPLEGSDPGNHSDFLARDLRRRTGSGSSATTRSRFA